MARRAWFGMLHHILYHVHLQSDNGNHSGSQMALVNIRAACHENVVFTNLLPFDIRVVSSLVIMDRGS